MPYSNGNGSSIHSQQLPPQGNGQFYWVYLGPSTGWVRYPGSPPSLNYSPGTPGYWITSDCPPNDTANCSRLPATYNPGTPGIWYGNSGTPATEFSVSFGSRQFPPGGGPLVSFFPPVIYNINCVSNPPTVVGGQSASVLYRVTVKMRAKICDPVSFDPIHPVFFNKTVLIQGPLRMIAAELQREGPGKSSVVLTVSRQNGVNLDTFTYETKNAFQYGDAQMSTPLSGTLIGSGYSLKDPEVIDYSIVRDDGLSEPTGTFFPNNFCTLTVYDGSGIIFQGSFLGTPSVTLGSLFGN